MKCEFASYLYILGKEPLATVNEKLSTPFPDTVAAVLNPYPICLFIYLFIYLLLMTPHENPHFLKDARFLGRREEEVINPDFLSKGQRIWG